MSEVVYYAQSPEAPPRALDHQPSRAALPRRFWATPRDRGGPSCGATIKVLRVPVEIQKGSLKVRALGGLGSRA